MKVFQKFLLSCIFLFLTSTSVFANLPYHPIQFPRDDAGHLANTPYPVKNMSEWWYYSGKLTSTEGRRFGYYLIIFNITQYKFGKKISVPIYTLQLTDIDNNKVYGNMIYYPNSESNFSNKKLDIALGKNKEVTLQKNGSVYQLDATTVSKQKTVVKLALAMQPTRKPLFIGSNGLIPMGNDTNSYYYSFTRMNTTGSLQIGNETFKIDESKSSSWMDHQWGDFMLSPKNKWFWTSIRLDNNIDINLTNVLDSDTKEPGAIKMANIMMPNGKVIFTSDFVVKQTVHSPYAYPLTYDIEIKPIKLKMHITSLADNQNCNTFWEGISRVDGTYQGKPIHGFTYVENTSRYGRPFGLFLDSISSPIEQMWHVMRAM
jgi:predicted secreted hydrolase